MHDKALEVKVHLAIAMNQNHGRLEYMTNGNYCILERGCKSWPVSKTRKKKCMRKEKKR